mgnify:CR=1 FL=1
MWACLSYVLGSRLGLGLGLGLEMLSRNHRNGWRERERREGGGYYWDAIKRYGSFKMRVVSWAHCCHGQMGVNRFVVCSGFTIALLFFSFLFFSFRFVSFCFPDSRSCMAIDATLFQSIRRGSRHRHRHRHGYFRGVDIHIAATFGAVAISSYNSVEVVGS